MNKKLNLSDIINTLGVFIQSLGIDDLYWTVESQLFINEPAHIIGIQPKTNDRLCQLAAKIETISDVDFFGVKNGMSEDGKPFGVLDILTTFQDYQFRTRLYGGFAISMARAEAEILPAVV